MVCGFGDGCVGLPGETDTKLEDAFKRLGESGVRLRGKSWGFRFRDSGAGFRA